MKKILSLALALLMLLSCVSAFADAIPAEGYDGSEVTLKFYHVITKDDQLAIINEAIAEFNKTYPNIHVELENVGGSYNGILNTVKEQLPAGNEPNIAFCYMDHVAAYNDQAGSIQVLDELIDHPVVGLTAEQKADFIPGYYKEGASLGDGKMYALPFYKSTEVLYYNKTFFDENNLTAPVTWDDLEAVCAKIKEINPKSIPLGYDSEGNWFITLTEQYGSDYTSATEPHYLFDNDTNKDFIRKINDWYNKGYVTTAGLYGNYTSGLFVSTEEMRSYMSIGSSAGATHQRPKKNDDGSYPFEVGIVPMPQVDPANAKAISQGPSVCIFAYKKPVQEKTELEQAAEEAAAEGGGIENGESKVENSESPSDNPSSPDASDDAAPPGGAAEDAVPRGGVVAADDDDDFFIDDTPDEFDDDDDDDLDDDEAEEELDDEEDDDES